MGWDWTRAQHYKNGKVDRKAELDETFTWENEQRTYSVVKSQMKGSTYYAAIKKVTKETNEETVWCLVCLTKTDKKDYFNFGYKAMDETMGPLHYECPNAILDLLTETKDTTAIKWRQKCRERNERKKISVPLGKLPIGTRIKFNLGPEEIILVHREPAHQFKTTWWQLATGKKYGYWSKKHIPDTYVILPD